MIGRGREKRLGHDYSPAKHSPVILGFPKQEQGKKWWQKNLCFYIFAPIFCLSLFVWPAVSFQSFVWLRLPRWGFALNSHCMLPAEMSLLAHGVGFRQPPLDLAVNFRHRAETEVVNMVSGGNGVSAPDAAVLHSASQNHVAVNPLQTRSQLREGHAHLKRDACLFRQHDHFSAAPNGRQHGVKDGPDFAGLAGKMRLQIVPAAEV
jgi:hypothetical protein